MPGWDVLKPISSLKSSAHLLLALLKTSRSQPVTAAMPRTSLQSRRPRRDILSFCSRLLFGSVEGCSGCVSDFGGGDRPWDEELIISSFQGCASVSIGSSSSCSECLREELIFLLTLDFLFILLRRDLLFDISQSISVSVSLPLQNPSSCTAYACLARCRPINNAFNLAII